MHSTTKMRKKALAGIVVSISGPTNGAFLLCKIFFLNIATMFVNFLATIFN